MIVALTIWHPLPALTLIALAAIGWWRYPHMFPQE
ncbi:1-acyl-sn-glycerol-3-phosphate acyltransferase [Dyella terrae]|nr:1-acyl-sn-glycerol-3-phosphate acyltransferase [Dyella terrae]